MRLLILAVWVLVTGFGTAEARVFNPETFALANGMQVVVIPNHKAPVVSHMVWYKVGAADEPSGQSGLAHLLEHLMFKGTARHPGGAFSQIVTRNGGQQNAFTSYDFTAYFQNIARDRLGLMMELEADRMRNLILNPKEVLSEAQVVLEERHQRVDNDPAAMLAEQTDAALYLNANYRRPIIGWEHEIANLSADELSHFYRSWYLPANAILVVAGDVTAGEVKTLAEETYGKVAAGKAPDRLVLAEPPAVAARQVTLADPRVRQPSWSRHVLAPSYVSGRTADAYPLQVLAEVLGGGPTSRLYRSLVVDQGKAVATGASYDPSRRGPGEFTLHATPRPGITVDQLAAAVEQVVEDVRKGAVTAEEVERAQQRLLTGAIYARDSLSAGAHVLGKALAIGLSIDDVESWPERIAAVTKDQVTDAARSVLEKERSVTARLLAVAEADRAGLEHRSSE